MDTLVWADALLAGILLISLVIGLFRGFVKEVFSLASWVLAVWVAILLGPDVAERWLAAIDSPTIRLASAYAGVFIAVLVAGAILAHMLTVLVARTHLQGTDRMLGLVFGLLRGVVIATALVLLARHTPLPEEPWWEHSLLIPHFDSLAYWAEDMLPEGWLPEPAPVAEPDPVLQES
ncbi:MAG: CvpA family protein [Oceanococcaceae bacterium]